MKNLREILSKWDYVIVIIGTIAVYCFFAKLDVEKMETYYQNTINISITMSGFLLALLAIWVVLPESEFMNYIRHKTNIFKRLIWTMFVGIISLISACIAAFFYLNIDVSIALMLIGISETVLATINFYRIVRANERFTKGQ